MKKLNLVALLTAVLILLAACKKTAITPTLSSVSLSIDKIDLIYCPQGPNWDEDNSSPDPVIVINKGNSVCTMHYSQNQVAPHYNNIQGQSLTFHLNTPFVIPTTAIHDYWTISVWDYDGNNGDYLGAHVFIPNDQKEGFPNTLTLEGSGVKFILHLTWQK